MNMISTKEDLDYILDYCSIIAKEMLSCGSTRIRVNTVLQETCLNYGLKDISIQTLANNISIGASTENGIFSFKTNQNSGLDINLSKLQALVRLSRDVRCSKPDPALLNQKLQSVLNSVVIYPLWLIILGNILARIALARIFGGGYQELIVVAFNAIILFFLKELNNKIKINHFIFNFFCTFLTGIFSAFMVTIGFASNFYVIVLTNALFFFPGITMVNAARNILCGYEINGSTELVKVIIDTLSIVGGLAAAFYIFGNNIPLSIEESFRNIDYATNILEDIELVGLTFMSSFGFGIIFNLEMKDWILAAIAGALVRTFYIIFQILIPDYVLVYMLLAAFSAGIYAEILGIINKTASTYYLYPSIIPLIPGGTLAYTIFGLIWNNSYLLQENGLNCINALIGLSVGFALSSAISYYFRKFKGKK